MVALAKRHGLDVDIFGHKASYAHKKSPSGGLLEVVILNELPPAPITSSTTAEWQLLAGTIKHTYSDMYPGQDIVVAPSIMTGLSLFLFALGQCNERLKQRDL